MAVLVDTNVILDILTDDSEWADWSDEQLSAHQPAGLIVNPVIFAELCVNASDPAEVNRILDHLKLKFAEIPRVALFTAAKAFLAYRKRGSKKTSPLPYFFIGAHAETTETPLLTRDPSRFRTYFPKARVIAPNS